MAMAMRVAVFLLLTMMVLAQETDDRLDQFRQEQKRLSYLTGAVQEYFALTQQEVSASLECHTIEVPKTRDESSYLPICKVCWTTPKNKKGCDYFDPFPKP